MSHLLILACSGPGAPDAMARASLVGVGCLLISFAATVFAIVRARRLAVRAPALAAVLLLLFHPTVWLGVTSGDCGRMLLMVGPAVAVVHAGIAGFLMLRKRPG